MSTTESSSSKLLNITLSDEQWEELKNLSHDGIRCLFKYWTAPRDNSVGLQCNATWDSIFCWPPTPANTRVERSCGEAMELSGADRSPGDDTAKAFRECDETGHWRSEKTNFNECLPLVTDDHYPEADTMAYIMFVGSMLSFLALTLTLVIFCRFKSLQCDRISVHKHLCVALLIRVLFNIVMVEPIVTGRSNQSSYTNVDWLCKGILMIKMYSLLASVNWMFIEGLYLHSRVTTSVFNSKPPFKLYYALGWGDPLIIITLWSVIMGHSHKQKCWNGYAELNHIWLLVVPICVALAMNLLFLINIIRILVTKLRSSVAIETAQVRKAIKATAVLFPLLGLPLLFMCVNPGDNGNFEDVYLYTNVVMESSQGIFVAVLYCFTNSEVIVALRKEYNRFLYRIHNDGAQGKKLRSKSARSVSFLENTAASFAANHSQCPPPAPPTPPTHNQRLNNHQAASNIVISSAPLNYKSPLREVKKSFWVRWAIKCQRPSALVMSKEEEEQYLQKKLNRNGSGKRASDSDCLV